MATAPYFVLSPNTILSIVGFIRGPDKTEPTPPEDWRKATVDVVIPALNEVSNIALCLASLKEQTVKPCHIILIDDGSSDDTVEAAKSFCEKNGMDLTAVQRKESIGKTPTIKRQAREFEADVEFILDGDTVLESPDYIERTVEELYMAVGIASACGAILPLRHADRVEWRKKEPLKEFKHNHPELSLKRHRRFLPRIRQFISDTYRSVLYTFLQRFLYRGQMVFFGGITNPVGCAVAYRRKYVKDLFDKYEPIMGDDLTNSEDIFIGFALAAKGYRNIQLQDVTARSSEPQAHKLPRQVYLWSSSFLQSCYYFDVLLRSPFKAFKRYRKRRREKKDREIQEKRKIKEPYRQAFGEEYTEKYGRPIGWVLLMSAIEKIGFPTALLIMIILRLWEPLVITLIAEMAVSLTITGFSAPKGRKLKFLGQGILITPVRYVSLMSDLVTMIIFLFHVWFVKGRRWRK